MSQMSIRRCFTSGLRDVYRNNLACNIKNKQVRWFTVTRGLTRREKIVEYGSFLVVCGMSAFIGTVTIKFFLENEKNKEKLLEHDAYRELLTFLKMFTLKEIAINDVLKYEIREVDNTQSISAEFKISENVWVSFESVKNVNSEKWIIKTLKVDNSEQRYNLVTACTISPDIRGDLNSINSSLSNFPHKSVSSLSPYRSELIRGLPVLGVLFCSFCCYSFFPVFTRNSSKSIEIAICRLLQEHPHVIKEIGGGPTLFGSKLTARAMITSINKNIRADSFEITVGLNGKNGTRSAHVEGVKISAQAYSLKDIELYEDWKITYCTLQDKNNESRIPFNLSDNDEKLRIPLKML